MSATASSTVPAIGAPACGRFGAGLLLAAAGSVPFSGKAIVIKLAYLFLGEAITGWQLAGVFVLSKKEKTR